MTFRVYFGRKIAAAGGGVVVTAGADSYTLTGTAASILVKRKLDATTAGSYALTGTAASVLHKWRMDATTAGSYALTGTTATIIKSGGNKVLPADAGSYGLTGTAAGVLHKWIVSATTAGSYALTGTAVSILHKWRVDATAGSYSLTGTAAGVLHGWKLAASGGAYSLTGSDAAIVKLTAGAYRLSADGGSYMLTGTPATIVKGVPSVPGVLPGGPKVLGRRGYRKLRINHIFIREDEPEKVLKPTKKRVQALQTAVLAEAEGLLGTALPKDSQRALRHDIVEAYTPRVDSDELSDLIETMIMIAIDKVQREIEEEDEEIFLMSL